MTDAEAAPRRRPLEVTLVVVGTYLSAVLGVLLGIVVIFSRYVDDVRAEGLVAAVTITGAALVLFGLLIAAVASGVARGDRTARVTLTVLLGGYIALHVATAIASPADVWGQVFAIAVPVAVIVLVWTGRASRWFARPFDAAPAGARSAPPRSR